MLILLGLGLIWIVLPGPARRHGVIARVGLAALLRGFGLRVRCHGAPLNPESTLFVANHTSWTDIPVLASRLDAAFIAKVEVSRWPLIGALARRHGTLFVERERRSVRDEAAAVAHGQILFPEGTTGDGVVLLPFMSSLFAQAAGRGWRVQPIAIRASHRDGTPFTTDECRGFAWIGDEDLLSHVLRLAASGGATVDVWFEPPISGQDRKQLAQASREAIAMRLDQAAALKRAT